MAHSNLLVPGREALEAKITQYFWSKSGLYIQSNFIMKGLVLMGDVQHLSIFSLKI